MSKSKKRIGRPLAIFIIVLIIVSLFVFFGTQLGGGSLRRIIYMIGSGVSGSAEETTIMFDSNDSNRFHSFSGGFAVLANDGMHIYSMSGKEKSFTALTYHTPSIAGSKKTVVAYDRNGQSFTVLDDEKILHTGKTDAPIINLEMNNSGDFSIVTTGTDCRSLVTVYNDSIKELYKLHSAEQYIFTAPVSEDSKRMATVGFSASSGQFAGIISFYKLDQEAPINTVSLTDCMPLSATFQTDGELLVLCEDRILRFSESGEKLNELTFDGLSISAASIAKKQVSSVLLDSSQIGGNSKLHLISDKENTSLDFHEDIFSISSAGKYTAITFADRIEVYTSNGELHHSFPLAQGASSCIMREDGTVFAIGNNYASLLIP